MPRALTVLIAILATVLVGSAIRTPRPDRPGIALPTVRSATTTAPLPVHSEPPTSPSQPPETTTPPTVPPIAQTAVQAPPAAPPQMASPVSLQPCGGDLPPCYVKQRESGGNYQAYNASSGAAGAWQFIPSTWAGFGGYASARDAPPEVQDEKARALWAGGAGCSHWAACG